MLRILRVEVESHYRGKTVHAQNITKKKSTYASLVEISKTDQQQQDPDLQHFLRVKQLSRMRNQKQRFGLAVLLIKLKQICPVEWIIRILYVMLTMLMSMHFLQPGRWLIPALLQKMSTAPPKCFSQPSYRATRSDRFVTSQLSAE
jgi:hypothetical protein